LDEPEDIRDAIMDYYETNGSIQLSQDHQLQI